MGWQELFAIMKSDLEGRGVTVPPPLLGLAYETAQAVLPRWADIDARARCNFARVLRAFGEARLSELSFAPTTGYGYNDLGRAQLEKSFASVFGGQSALVRSQITSGTHAITLGLFGNLQPGDQLLSVGPPYDSLQTVIGHHMDKPARGALVELGVAYRESAWGENGLPDEDDLARCCTNQTALVFIQRSRGYQTRRSLPMAVIKRLVAVVRKHAPQAAVMVDNCYGEFVAEVEPGHVGADLVAGSLIKNPGGGLAPTGGYLVGREDLIAGAAARLTAPGLGAALGATIGTEKRLMFQGLFLAPALVGEALKGAVFAAEFFQRLGFKVDPLPEQDRADIIQVIELGQEEFVTDFCLGVQRAGAVEWWVRPVAGDLPGYVDPVLMAAPTFIQGASLELSADAPLRHPYRVYLQGGLQASQTIAACLSAAAQMGL